MFFAYSCSCKDLKEKLVENTDKFICKGKLLHQAPSSRTNVDVFIWSHEGFLLDCAAVFWGMTAEKLRVWRRWGCVLIS